MSPINGSHAPARMAREWQLMLKDALDAYIHRDAELALTVIQREPRCEQNVQCAVREFRTL